MASKKQTYSVAPSQVVGPVRGWYTLTLTDGSTVKVRKSQIRQLGGLTNRRVGNRRYDCSGYVRKYKGATLKSVSGHATMDNGDELAVELRGAELDKVYQIASKVLGETQTALKARYEHLNPGMQRMNLGNRIRAAQAESAEA